MVRNKILVQSEPALKLAFGIYQLAWQISMPMLRRNPRLAVGFDQRTLKTPPAQRADLWLQAPSVGEAYLAWGLLRTLAGQRSLSVLASTNTAQGMDILTRAVADCAATDPPLKLQLAYFPFDQPRIMDKAVAAVRPRLMVLLETEIWPGLMMALRRRRTPTVIVNGRLSDRSFKRYRLASSILRQLQPRHILAVSQADADRFARVFDTAQVAVMPNMKFDQLEPDHSAAAVNAALSKIISNQHPFVVFGSVRQEEEAAVETMIKRLLAHSPQIVVGLFPRHMHRLGSWKALLRQTGIPVTRRSRIQTAPAGGGVVLWDTFGELKHAYRLAHSVFVGGSLAPLGGQNFIEPLLCGVRPVIGPHWDNFAWAGDALVARELVQVAQTPESAAQKMIAALNHPDDPERVRHSAMAYIQSRQGGTDRACELILNQLETV